jgi:virginiamycin A acetyltransferase
MREALKAVARALATLVVVPALVSYQIRRRLIGADRALQGSTQLLSLVPGVGGNYLRRAFLAWTLEACDPTATIAFGTLFSQTAARIEANVYVGPRSFLGWVHLERDVLIAAGVQIPSGPFTHGTASLDRPIRVQPGSLRMVRIGEGSWIGSGAVVLADVGKHCVVAAGAVVTKPLPDYVIAGGVPATILRSRRDPPPPA